MSTRPGDAGPAGDPPETPAAAPAGDALYRSLFEHTVDAMAIHRVVLDADGRPVDYVFLDVNPAFERQTGLVREAVLGRRVTEVLPGIERDPADWIGRYGRVALTGETARFQQLAVALQRWYDVTAFSPERGIFAVVFTDVTGHMRLEAALREADQNKSTFLAVLSHELRGPLAAILNGAALLERIGGQSEQAQRTRDVIDRQARHLAQLVDDLLDVTRIARGKLALQRTVLDAREVLRRAVEDHRSAFQEAGVGLSLDTPAGPIWIDGDPTRLAQLVGNLLQNSLKFTPRGGSASAWTRREDDRALIRICDDGAGIAPEVADRIFEPFVQAERTLPHAKGGLGLGLALVKGLAEQHGGSVTARSAGPGRGAEFLVTLPLSPAPVQERGPPAAPGGLRPRSVLIVEDDRDTAQTLAELLALSGHRVQVANDAATGIALARQLRPDVILCDIGLPDRDGYEVARELRADPDLAATRLVALSGWAQPEDVQRALEAGFEAHLPKPPALDRLEALLAQGA